LAVLKILASSEGHPSVDQIYDLVKKDFPTTSLATIYKTLTLLKEIGEVLELGFSDGSNRYDGSKPFPHPHLICIKCKNIIDSDTPSLQEIVKELSETSGYEILNYRLDFLGLCPKCKKNISE
jgi:Fur family peroxide stress response transcriptional regulator